MNVGVVTAKGRQAEPTLTQQLKKLLKSVIHYVDKHGRRLSDVFQKLPSRAELPRYYEIIKDPMDFCQMKEKIGSGQYDSIDEMAEDMQLLCENARTYNMEGSQIYEDSIVLEGVFNEMKERIEQGQGLGAVEPMEYVEGVAEDVPSDTECD
jgi:SWI/SNF-related matrix-associated actin-dependent regulator of chromatin subfamily A protein 2/4